MIITFPEFAEFSESRAPFRKNSNVDIFVLHILKISKIEELVTSVCIQSTLLNA